MKISAILVVSFFLSASGTNAQTFTIDTSKKTIDISEQPNGVEIHLPGVTKKPDFPGGKIAWQSFLRSNIDIKVPFNNKALPGIYKVMIRFIVNSDGKLREVGADTNCGYGMEAEVIRCIKKSVDWIPAETNSGKKVSFTLRQIVIFTVKKDNVQISFQ